MEALGALARLVGGWRGEGRGRWGEARFGYREELEFVHTGKPHLVYQQRTWAADDGRPLHAERGYWRAIGDATELVIAHPIGVAELSLGRWIAPGVLDVVSAALALAPSAKPVTALTRRYELDDDELRCTVAMSTDGGQPLPHLEARLHRVG